jgi:hypothetical protein
MHRSFLLLALLPTVASADEWYTNNSDRASGSPESACLEHLKGDGVTYKVEIKASDNNNPDVKYCYYKNKDHDGPATSYQPIYRKVAVPKSQRGGEPAASTVTLYRGTAVSRRKTSTTHDHDLGPCVYYAFDADVARSYAIAAFLEDWAAPATPPAKPVEAVVLETSFQMPTSGVLDFSSGPARAEFERELSTNKEILAMFPRGDKAPRMLSGMVNPLVYYKTLTVWLRAKNKKPSDYAVLIGPDYRHKSKQACITDAAIVRKLDAAAKNRSTVAFPTASELGAALHDIENTPLPQCTGTSRSGACTDWPLDAGKALLMRRGWRALIYSVNHGKGPHTHLRVGNIILDGAFTQFDFDVRNDPDRGKEVFVGTEPELVDRLGRFVKPAISGGGRALFDMYWAVTGVSPKKQRLGFDARGEGAFQ